MIRRWIIALTTSGMGIAGLVVPDEPGIVTLAVGLGAGFLIGLAFASFPVNGTPKDDLDHLLDS